MNIDLTKVPIRKMEYASVVQIPKSYYDKMAIIDIRDVNVKFSITSDVNQDDILDLSCQGTFILQDARDLKEVSYPFQFELNEKITEDSEICGRFLENSQNTLDIMAILWENIVLENPISYTECDFLENPKENVGWRVVGEKDDEEIDPRLAPLMELLDKKKE